MNMQQIESLEEENQRDLLKQNLIVFKIKILKFIILFTTIIYRVKTRTTTVF